MTDNVVARNRAATASVLNHQTLTAANCDRAATFDLYGSVLVDRPQLAVFCDHIGQ